MKVVTWNLWWQFGPWEERQPLIVDELRRLAPDIACFQEVWSDDTTDQARQLSDALNLNVVRTVTADGTPQTFGNAIVSRFPLERAGQMALPSADGTPGHRSVLAAWADIGNRRQLIVNTHLEWRYSLSELRQRQLEAVVDFIADLQVKPRPSPEGTKVPDPDAVILTGDLNAVPESAEVRRLTGLEAPYRTDLIFTDAWAATNDEPGYTWTRDNPNAENALWPRRRLDYVLVSWPRPKPWANPISAVLAGTDVVTTATGRPMAPSDHYAVAVELDSRQTLGHD